MKDPKNFKLPKQYKGTHFKYHATTPDLDQWYLVPHEALNKLREKEYNKYDKHECLPINLDGFVVDGAGVLMNNVQLGIDDGDRVMVIQPSAYSTNIEHGDFGQIVDFLGGHTYKIRLDKGGCLDLTEDQFERTD